MKKSLQIMVGVTCIYYWLTYHKVNRPIRLHVNRSYIIPWGVSIIAQENGLGKTLIKVDSECMKMVLGSGSIVFLNDKCISGDDIATLSICSMDGFSACLEGNRSYPRLTASPMMETCLTTDNSHKYSTSCSQTHSKTIITTPTATISAPVSVPATPAITPTTAATVTYNSRITTTTSSTSINCTSTDGGDIGAGIFTGHMVYYSIGGLVLGVSIAINIILTCITVCLLRYRRRPRAHVRPKVSVRSKVSVRPTIHEQRDENTRQMNETKRMSEVAEYITIIGHGGMDYYSDNMTDSMYEAIKQNEGEMTTSIGHDKAEKEKPHPLSNTLKFSKLDNDTHPDIPIYTKVDDTSAPPLPSPYRSYEDLQDVGVASDNLPTYTVVINEEAPPIPPPIYSYLTEEVYKEDEII